MAMLRIAICDDEEQQLKQMVALLEAYLQSRTELKGQVETFLSGDALLERTEQSRGFDIYILDILMPELNGIETGHRLRALGMGGEIVYLTSSNDFAADSYDVRAFFYLLKPVDRKKLFHVMDGAVKNAQPSTEQRNCCKYAGWAQAHTAGTHSICGANRPPHALSLYRWRCGFSDHSSFISRDDRSPAG